MRKYFFLVIYCFAVFTSLAQSHIGFSKLFHYSGDTLRRADGVNALMYDSTGNCLYFTTSGFAQTDGRLSSVFYKTDLNGNLLKDVLDTFANGSVYYHALAESKDHQYLYWGGGCFITQPSIQTQWKLRKTDKNLNTVWERFYQVETTDALTWSIQALPDSGHIMLLCNKFTPENTLGYPEMPSRIYLRKLDSMGNVLTEYSPGPTNYHVGQNMELTDDGGYLINGRTFSWGQNNGGAYVLKADVEGNEEWHQLYAQEMYTTWLNDLTKAKGNIESYYNVGQTSPDNNYATGFINKINGQGNEFWNKKVIKNGNSDCFFGVCSDASGGAVACGSAYFPDKSTARGWMVCMDKDGNKLWDRLYTTPHAEQMHDYIYRVVDLPDGSFVAAGSSFGQDEAGFWSQEGWLLRVDSSGCSTPNCSEDLAINEVPSGKENFDVYPNPSSGLIFLENSTPFPAQTSVSLRDNLGRTVKTLLSPSGKTKMQYDLKGVVPGVYYLQVESKGLVTQKKITLR